MATNKLDFESLYNEIVKNHDAEAFALIQKAAANNNPDALKWLGDCYFYGQGVTEDKPEAVKCYIKSSEMGNGPAQFELGRCYYTGEGVERDTIKAEKWMHKSMMNECPGARELWIKYDGENRFVKTFHEATVLNDARAQYYLGMEYIYGRFVEKDEAKGLQYLYQSAENSGELAPYHLAYFYFKGMYVEKDIAEGVKILRKASDMGNPAAQFALGKCCLAGYGTEKDEAEAFKLLGQAADHGIDFAYFYLGLCFLRGYGVEKNEDEALKCFYNILAEHHKPFNPGENYSAIRLVADEPVIESLVDNIHQISL